MANSGQKKFREDNGAVWVRKDTDQNGKPRTMLSMIVDGVSYVAFQNQPKDRDGKPRALKEKEPNFRVYKSLKNGKSEPKKQEADEIAPF